MFLVQVFKNGVRVGLELVRTEEVKDFECRCVNNGCTCSHEQVSQ